MHKLAKCKWGLSLHPKALLWHCSLQDSFPLCYAFNTREYLALQQIKKLLYKVNLHIPCSAFTSYLSALSYRLQTPLLFIFPFPSCWYLSPVSQAFSCSLAPPSACFWQPLLNREQQTVKAGKWQCVEGVFARVSSGTFGRRQGRIVSSLKNCNLIIYLMHICVELFIFSLVAFNFPAGALWHIP